jgi:hypothetical protein
MSPALYRRLIRPAHTRMAQAVQKFDKPVLLHSCGSVAAFIPDPTENATGTSGAERVAADSKGVIYGAEVGQKDLKKYVRK